MAVPTIAPERFAHVLASSGADFFVALSDGRHWFLDTDLVVALSGHKSIGESAAVVDRAGRLTLVSAPGWERTRLASVSGAHATVATDDVARALLELTRVETATPTLAVHGLDAASEAVRRAIEAGATVIPVDDLVPVAGPKTRTELDRARRAAEIAEDGYRATLTEIGPGTAEFEITARLDAHCRARGAEDNFLLISSGSPGHPVRLPTKRALTRGDVVNAEISPSVDMQFAQICRTAIVGPATPLQRQRHDLLARAYDAALEVASPGTRVRDLVAAIDGLITAAGFGEYCRPPHMRVRGHALGVTSGAPGALTNDNETELLPGMMFVLHPNQALPGSGYLLCGNPIVITQDGAVPLIDGDVRLDEIEV